MRSSGAGRRSLRVRAEAAGAAKRVAVVGAGPAGLTLAHALLTLPSGAEHVQVDPPPPLYLYHQRRGRPGTPPATQLHCSVSCVCLLTCLSPVSVYSRVCLLCLSTHVSVSCVCLLTCLPPVSVYSRVCLLCLSTHVALCAPQVFERYDAVRPDVGAGFNINGGAVMLQRLGLAEELAKISNPLGRVLARTVKGEVQNPRTVAWFISPRSHRQSVREPN
jgi:hypothetical protein